MSRHTTRQIAESYELFEEHFDRDGLISREEWDAHDADYWEAKCDQMSPDDAVSEAARTLGRIKTPRKTAASRESIRKATAASPHSGRPRSTYYEAVAQHSGQDAGIVCSALTREACRELAHQRTTMTVRIRRVRSTPEAIKALTAVGKL